VGEGEGLGDGLAVGEGVGLGEAVRVGEGEGGALSPTVPQPLSKAAAVRARQAVAPALPFLAMLWGIVLRREIATWMEAILDCCINGWSIPGLAEIRRCVEAGKAAEERGGRLCAGRYRLAACSFLRRR